MPIPIKALSEPFPDSLIKRRKGNFGQMLDYAEAVTVIHRLNDVLEGQWSFSIIGYRIEAEEVIVQGELKIAEEIHQQFGGSLITRKTDTGEMVSLADDLKAAASDCLKKCASSFGVGLYLYSDSPVKQNRRRQPAESNGNGQQKAPVVGSNGNGHLTQDMIAGLFKQAQEAGFQQVEVIQEAKRLFSKPVGQLTVVQAQDLVKVLNQSKAKVLTG